MHPGEVEFLNLVIGRKMATKSLSNPSAASKCTDANSYAQAVVERLVALGLSRPFAQLSVEQEVRYLDARWKEGGSVEDAASGIFGPEIEPGADGYRDAVGMFLEHYELSTGHAESILDANNDILAKSHKAKMPPWAVAASLLYKAPNVAPYPVVEVNEPRIHLEIPEHSLDMLEAVASIKLLGENINAVVTTLVNQGLLQLARDGFVKLPHRSVNNR